MLLLIATFLSFSYCHMVYSLNHTYDNPNNYLDYSIKSIQKELKKRTEQSYYDILILKIHVQANTKYIQTSIDENIDKIIKPKNNLQQCNKMLTNYKKEQIDNCLMNEDFKTLTTTRAKYDKLYKVACLTSEICEDLNPFESEIESLEKCQVEKIADLNYQTELVEKEFENVKLKLFKDHDECVGSAMAKFYSDISNLCTNLQ